VLCIRLVDGTARCEHRGLRCRCRFPGTEDVAGHLRSRRGCGRSGGRGAGMVFVHRAAAAVVIPPRRQLPLAARRARARRAAAAAAGCGARGPAPQHLRRCTAAPSPSPSPSPTRRRLRRHRRHRRRGRRRRRDAPAATPPPSAAAAPLQPVAPLLRARGGLLLLPGEQLLLGVWMEHGLEKEAAGAVTGQRGAAPSASASTNHGASLERRHRTGRCGRCGGAASALRRRARPRLLQPCDQLRLGAALVQPPRLAPGPQLRLIETLE
jgi:hypothetical protein